MISFIFSLFCIHRWKRLSRVRCAKLYFDGSVAREYSVVVEECERCGKTRQIRLGP